jgi:hypothetical protein
MSLAVARARYRSAAREASVGGDLYEISCPTWHGIRVIIGDVRGKGLDAILLARVRPERIPAKRGRRARHGTTRCSLNAAGKSHGCRHDVVRTGTTCV